MNIVILINSLIGGGAERVAALWAKGFVNFGFSVTIITQSNSLKRYETHEKVKIINIQYWIHNGYVLRLLMLLGFVRRDYLKKLDKLLHTINPDICIGVMGAYARDAFSLTRDLKTLVIQTYHNSFELPDDAPSIRKKDLKTRFLKDQVIPIRTVLTEADKLCIGARMEKVYVMPNPLAFPALTKLPQKEKIVMACGRLDVWDVKGFDVLIKAWGKIAKHYNDWRLIIIGDGRNSSKKFLQELAKENNSPVEFIGFQKNIELFYRKSEIFVLSSRYEGFGMVVIEAMSQGCACVVCDYKGRQKEIINNRNQGMLCPPNSVDELASAIDTMIVDENYRKLCQKNALIRSDDYSVEKTTKRWIKIFEESGKIN